MRAVGHCGRNNQAADAADLHARDTLGPASDDATERKRNGFTKVVRTLENGAVGTQRTGVMCGDRCAWLYDVARAFLHINDLQFRHTSDRRKVCKLGTFEFVGWIHALSVAGNYNEAMQEYSVVVEPGSKKGLLVMAGHDGGLVVYVPERAVDGKANEAVTALLAKHFGVAKSKVEIVHGRTARHKVIRIAAS